jgi:predicted polyphosphate/ATP-dependent NAD kinase
MVEGGRIRLGLVVNPIAGVGGPTALKGSDDPSLVAAALAGGADAPAPRRAGVALAALADAGAELEVLAGPLEMGEQAARAAGLGVEAVGSIEPGRTSAADTRRIARMLADRGVDLLLFAGGDGTAADLLAAVGERVPVVGIPSGVKMHSAVFATSPRAAAEVVLALAAGRVRELAEREVMDVDERAVRDGLVSPRLHGFLLVPVAPALLQSGKSRSLPAERAAQEGIAAYVAERYLDGLVLVGPGTTTRVLLEQLGYEKAVLGVDVLRAGGLVAADVDERTLFDLVSHEPARAIVTPVGGQGFLLGRGNQQLSPRVLRRIGPGRVVAVATEAKLAALAGRPLLVDTGDRELDAAFAGYRRVVTGYGREVVYRVAAA